MDEPLTKLLFRQIICGIGYFHQKNIVHRDIRLENIYLDNEGFVKIGGFGLALQIQKDEKPLKEQVGLV